MQERYRRCLRGWLKKELNPGLSGKSTLSLVKGLTVECYFKVSHRWDKKIEE
ncbi:unnamed protein product, partial [Cuscuta campestris]